MRQFCWVIMSHALLAGRTQPFVIELMPGSVVWDLGSGICNSWCTIYGPGDGRGLIANISSRDSSNPN